MKYDRAAVKLPRGQGVRKHPLLTAIEKAGITQADIARAIDVTPQSFNCWCAAAAKDANFLLPAERIPELSRVLGVRPGVLRPDLYLPAWEFPPRDMSKVTKRESAHVNA